MQDFLGMIESRVYGVRQFGFCTFVVRVAVVPPSAIRLWEVLEGVVGEVWPKPRRLMWSRS